ncbi:hypothetical protein MNEG_15244, partial [Monoraphidium neglectum]
SSVCDNRASGGSSGISDTSNIELSDGAHDQRSSTIGSSSSGRSCSGDDGAGGADRPGAAPCQHLRP